MLMHRGQPISNHFKVVIYANILEVPNKHLFSLACKQLICNNAKVSCQCFPCVIEY